MSKILTVVGATGVQGGSVVASALKDGKYKVRGITRNAQSESAKALASKGVEVVTASLDDVESLSKAFEGSHAIFALTNFFDSFFVTGSPESSYKTEVIQGKNLAVAASKTTTLEHYIWSSLPNCRAITDGKCSVPHMDSKNEIDAFIAGDKSLLAKTTFLWCSFYASNFIYPVFTPMYIPSAQKYLQLHPVSPDTPQTLLGSASHNVGVFVLSILAQPQKTLPGKKVLASTEVMSTSELLQLWSKVTGKPAVYTQVPPGVCEQLWGPWGKEAEVMMGFFEEARDRSFTAPGGILGREELGITEGLVDTETAFRETDWSSILTD